MMETDYYEKALRIKTSIELGELPEGLTTFESANARFREACQKAGLGKDARSTIVEEAKKRARMIREERKVPEDLQPLVEATVGDLKAIYKHLEAHPESTEGEIYVGIFGEEPGREKRVWHALMIMQRDDLIGFSRESPEKPRRYHINNTPVGETTKEETQ